MAKYSVSLEWRTVVDADSKKEAIKLAREKFNFNKAVSRVEFSECPHTPRCGNAPYTSVPYCCLGPGEEIDR